MSLIRNAASLLLTQAVAVPLGLGTSVILARYLSLDDRGYLALASALAGAASLIGAVGWPGATILRIRRFGTSPSRAAATTLVGVLALATLAVGIAYLFRGRLTDWLFAEAPANTLLWALALTPFMMLGNSFSGIARVIDRFSFQNGYRLALAAGRLVALTGVLVFAGGALLDALRASVVAQAVTVVALMTAVIATTRIRAGGVGPEVVGTLRIGARSWVLALAINLHERVDMFMLGYLLQDPSQVALYAIAAGVIVYLQMIPEAVAGAALPELAGREGAASSELAAATLRNALVFVVGAMLLAGLVAPIALPLVYGQPYAAAIPPFLVLLPAVAFHAIYLILWRYFYTIDRIRISVAIQLVTLPLNIGLNLLWIPSLGVVGAALASLTSYTVAGLLSIAAFVITTRTPLRDALLLKRSDIDGYRQRSQQLLARVRLRTAR